MFTIEAIVKKASQRKSFDQIPPNMKKLFVEEVTSADFKNKLDKKKLSKFYIQELTFQNPRPI